MFLTLKKNLMEFPKNSFTTCETKSAALVAAVPTTCGSMIGCSSAACHVSSVFWEHSANLMKSSRRVSSILCPPPPPK